VVSPHVPLGESSGQNEGAPKPRNGAMVKRKDKAHLKKAKQVREHFAGEVMVAVDGMQIKV
jgi:hypothetical protein